MKIFILKVNIFILENYIFLYIYFAHFCTANSFAPDRKYRTARTLFCTVIEDKSGGSPISRDRIVERWLVCIARWYLRTFPLYESGSPRTSERNDFAERCLPIRFVKLLRYEFRSNQLREVRFFLGVNTRRHAGILHLDRRFVKLICNFLITLCPDRVDVHTRSIRSQLNFKLTYELNTTSASEGFRFPSRTKAGNKTAWTRENRRQNRFLTGKLNRSHRQGEPAQLHSDRMDNQYARIRDSGALRAIKRSLWTYNVTYFLYNSVNLMRQPAWPTCAYAYVRVFFLAAWRNSSLISCKSPIKEVSRSRRLWRGRVTKQMLCRIRKSSWRKVVNC